MLTAACLVPVWYFLACASGPTAAGPGLAYGKAFTAMALTLAAVGIGARLLPRAPSAAT